jgi:hypothetical protein
VNEDGAAATTGPTAESATDDLPRSTAVTATRIVDPTSLDAS